jgi:hypothetical protein
MEGLTILSSHNFEVDYFPRLTQNGLRYRYIVVSPTKLDSHIVLLGSLFVAGFRFGYQVAEERQKSYSSKGYDIFTHQYYIKLIMNTLKHHIIPQNFTIQPQMLINH